VSTPSSDACLDDIEQDRRLVIDQPLSLGLQPEDARTHLSCLPLSRFPANAYAARGSSPMIQPRGGVPLFEAQRELTRLLADAGADFLPLTIDSYTRQNRYSVAEQLMQRGEEQDRNYLNGYPLIAHGFEVTRGLYKNLDRPVSLRHGTPDARLLVEVALASGVTEIEGGGICYCLPYSEAFPLDRSLLYWQYVDRVCAVLSTDNRLIHRESFGPLSATMVPPAIMVVVEILEALLAAEQGVRSFAVSFGQTGSIVQDLATAMCLRRLARMYLDQFGFRTVRLFLVYHQWMGQFPSNPSRAAALISSSALIASMIGADKIVVKTPDEAIGVPDPSVNADAVRDVRYVFEKFPQRGALSSPEIEAETALIDAEARSILEAIFDLSSSVLWESVYRAFQMGFIDIPFVPHVDNANRLVTVRSADGAIRIRDPGQVPFSQESVRLERELLADAEGRPGKIFEHMLADINLMI
jgi:methylaspartate mutase epsilon subunit